MPLLFVTTNLKAQNCIGDACSVVQTNPFSQQLGNNIWVTGTKFKNNSNRKIRIGTRPAVTGIGGGCGNISYNNLNSGESINIGGAYCPPFEALFTDNPPPPPLPPVVYTTPKIENGNYRIRNASTGKYLKWSWISGGIRQIIIVDCASITDATDYSYKWTINVINRSIAGSNTQETFEIKPNVSTNGPSLTAVEISDFHPPYYFRYDDYSVLYHLDYSVQGAKILTGGYLTTLTLHPNSNVYRWDNPIMQWEFVDVVGSNKYQIKGNGHYHFIAYENDIKSVRYEQIVGNPVNAQWYLERCE